MANKQAFHVLYQKSSIGLCLVDALDDLVVVTQRIEPQLAIKVLDQFYRIMEETLHKQVKDRLYIKGKLDTYRLCDEIWTMLLKDAELIMDKGRIMVKVDKIRIVAYPASGRAVM